MENRAADRHLEFGLIRQADKIRVVLVFFLVTISLFAGPAVLTIPSMAYTSLSLAALVCVWSLFFLRWDELLLRGRLPLAVTVLTLFDLGWMTLFILGTGGFESPFWALLLLVVVFAGAFLQRCLLVASADGAGGHQAVFAVMAGVEESGHGNPVWDLCGRLLIVVCTSWFTWGLASVLERERQANQRIVRHLTEGVLLINGEGRVLLANPQLCKFCGLAVQDIVGRSLEEVGATPGHALLRQLLKDVAQRPGGTAVRDVLIEGKQVYDLRCSTVPCGTGARPLGWVLIVQDMTDINAQTPAEGERAGAGVA